MMIFYQYSAYQLGIPIPIDWTPSPTAPPHWLIIGASGTGKTVCTATLLARIMLHIPESRLWIASYKDDDFFSGFQSSEGRYYRFKEAVKGIAEFCAILEARLAGDPERTHCFLWVDELAALVTSLPKKEADFVKNAVVVILQTGRSLNCQIFVSVQRPDSTYFNNGARENFGNIVLLGGHMSKETAGMFSIDRDALLPVTGRAGYFIQNGNNEAITAIQVPVIRDTKKVKAALLDGIRR